MATRPLRGIVSVLVSVAGVLALSACGPDAYDLPLSSGVGGNAIHITAQFADALNLTLGAKVEVNGIDVGRVRDVFVEGHHAVANIDLKRSAKLRKSATARLRYNTPLGELFVDMKSPGSGPLLVDGDTLPLSQTSTAPTVEDTLASASLLINGGGLDQLKTISEELPRAFDDNGTVARDLIDRTSRFLSEADATTGDANAALASLASASAVLRHGNATIDAALRDIGPAASVVHQQTPRVVRLLQQASTLATTSNQFVQQNGDQLLSSIREAGPIFDTFFSLRDRFAPGLRGVVALSEALLRVVPGEWGPVEVMVALNETVIGQQSGSGASGGGLPGLPGGPTGGSTGTPPAGGGLPNLPNLLGSLTGLLGGAS